jgi:phage tail sheath gpL-like
MSAYDLSDNDLALLAQLAFSPSDDPAASAGASSIRVVNARETTAQASLDIGPLTIKSVIYGTKGNRLNAALTIAGDTHTLTLNRNGLSEEFKIESDPLFSIENEDTNDLTVVIEDGTATLTRNAVSLLSVGSEEAPTLKAFVTLANELTDVSATLIEVSEIALDEIDYISQTIGASSTETFKAPAYQLKQALSSSTLAEATLLNTSAAASLSATTQTATGGADGLTLDFEEALQSVENADVQIVVLFTEDSASQSKLSAHLTAASNAGYERQAYCAIASTETLANVKTRAASLNNAGIALASQSIKLVDPRAKTVTKSPKYTALMLGAMQAGSDTGEPLTRKRPRIIETSQSWDAYADIEQAIKSGTIAISTDNLGPRVERSITTYLTDNNPVYCEVSAYESILVSLRTLRAALADQIGRPTRASQIPLITSRVQSSLTAQVRDGVIKAFQNIQLEDLGDEVAISYEVAPVEPLNFISITAVAVRITA